ncbi:unnamed protein product [Penicillium salamii]|uniref:Uncharacterized protein n=1 Tax=Penicillium salamii TaxID=1612424 RepID=A0A9W4NK42_9EURO|nr:unnamed protein product [Penicillium salamii]CAG7991057.1 unnamed protein product [Penicillium salamii]CAG8272563.1 unnamed protein product [Penicillium salamii]CAG8354439.1 unnamed protein product [Penicillium salamii]CAG8357879.1 unnamed protein product [Penicillium salamii]
MRHVGSGDPGRTAHLFPPLQVISCTGIFNSAFLIEFNRPNTPAPYLKSFGKKRGTDLYQRARFQPSTFKRSSFIKTTESRRWKRSKLS